jgi:hypothetical protein
VSCNAACVRRACPEDRDHDCSVVKGLISQGDTVCHRRLTTRTVALRVFLVASHLSTGRVFPSSTEFEEPDRSGAVEERRFGPTPAWRPTESSRPLSTGL